MSGLINDDAKGIQHQKINEEGEKDEHSNAVENVQWYRSTYYNAIILGICNFLTPGIWGAMNSLGAGGEEKPYLVNAANSLTFALMVVSCIFSSTIVRHIGIKGALILGTIGFAPYAAGLYTNNRFGNEWLVLVGAATCGISAGVFWMAQSSIAIAYPETANQGRFLGLWLSFLLGGQVLGGAINLGLNASRNEAGQVSYHVYEAFIALQALGPVIALLLTKPSKVQRKDGIVVNMDITNNSLLELKLTAELFCTKEFLLLIPVIGQGVYTEAVMFTYEALWFSVRARALGSFLSGIAAIIAGNLLGAFLDKTSIALKKRARVSLLVGLGLQGAWWTWAAILVVDFGKTTPVFDWNDDGFGRAFVLFLLFVAWFQINYMYLYFVINNLARSQAEVIRMAGLLRATQSAWQAISYGLNSLPVMASTGGVYLNFGLWGISVVPAWFVVREIGVSLGDRRAQRETRPGLDFPKV